MNNNDAFSTLPVLWPHLYQQVWRGESYSALPVQLTQMIYN